MGDRSGRYCGKGFGSHRPRAPHLERDLAGSHGNSLSDQRPDLVDSLRSLLVRRLACLPEEIAEPADQGFAMSTRPRKRNRCGSRVLANK